MSMYNYVCGFITCPRCLNEVSIKAEIRIGLRDLREYEIGQKVEWVMRRSPSNGGRPENGNTNVEGYVLCPSCDRDFWVNVVICNDMIVELIALEKPGYIPQGLTQTLLDHLQDFDKE